MNYEHKVLRDALRRFSDGEHPIDIEEATGVHRAQVTSLAHFAGVGEESMLSDDELDAAIDARWPGLKPPPKMEIVAAEPMLPEIREPVAASGQMETFMEGLRAHAENDRAQLVSGGTEQERAAALLKGVTGAIIGQSIEFGVPAATKIKDLLAVVKLHKDLTGLSDKRGRNKNGIDIRILDGRGKREAQKVIDV